MTIRACRVHAQSRDEPVVVHFVGGESKPWAFMVLKFQGLEEQVPPAVRKLTHAWDQMYWLAKTNRVCAGSLSDDEKWQARALLEADRSTSSIET